MTLISGITSFNVTCADALAALADTETSLKPSFVMTGLAWTTRAEWSAILVRDDSPGVSYKLVNDAIRCVNDDDGCL
jgi:hypothetical protein